jgi:hypothetical protein
MKINQPGVARQRYPGVNAESISTLKRVVSAGLGICSPGISAGQKNFVAPRCLMEKRHRRVLSKPVI